MKIRMNDNKGTVISENSGQQIERWAAFDEDRREYFYAISVNGETLKWYGVLRMKESLKAFNKLLRAGFEQKRTEAYIDEQERAWAEGTAADCENPDRHGHECFTVLAGEDSGKYVWDYYKQRVVIESELTNPVAQQRIAQLRKENDKERIF